MKPVLVAGVRTQNSQGVLFFTENGKELRFIETSFEPHSFYQNPNNTSEFFVFVKEGKQSALVSLIENTPPVYFEATPNSLFYGHGQLSLDGSVFFASERMLNGKGRIVVRDANTLEVKKIYALPGFGPHDLFLKDEGKTLAVVMENYVHSLGKFSTSEILFLDAETGDVLNRSTLDHENLSLGHLSISRDGTVFGLMHDPDKISNRPLAYGISGDTLKSTDSSEQMERELMGQALSLVIDEDRRMVAVTYPDDHQFMIWDTSSKKRLFQTAEIKAVGVSLASDKSGFVVTADYGQVFKVDGENFKLSKVFQKDEYIFYAHHYLFLVP